MYIVVCLLVFSGYLDPFMSFLTQLQYKFIALRLSNQFIVFVLHLLSDNKLSNVLFVTNNV